MQQRLAGNQQGQSQDQQTRKCRAAPSENFDGTEEDPQVEQQQQQRQDDTVLLDEKGVGGIAFRVDHLYAHGALSGAFAQDAAVVDGDHRTLGVGQLVDRLFGLGLGPEVDPGFHAAAGRFAAAQIQQAGQHYGGEGQAQQFHQFTDPHPSDKHHHPRGEEDQHGRRGVGREDHYTGEQDGGQDGPRALAPDFALVGALPLQRVERGDDP